MGLIFTGCSKSKEEVLADETKKLELKVRSYVRTTLKDGDSAKFRNQYKMCGEVNAKNSFGAYTGFTKFIVTEDKILFESDFLESDYSKQAYKEAWIGYCK